MAAFTSPGVLADARAIAADFAGQGAATTLLSYLDLHPLATYGIAHRLWVTRWRKSAAQAIATASTNATGNTIHPSALIGDRLLIEHGNEVVMGATSAAGLLLAMPPRP